MNETMMNDDMAMGEHRDLLDIIDHLRSQGVGHYIDLPEIIVCGDQSAGKSSVLEAISRMPFPTKDGLCTRFATELVLRRGSEAKPKISITPGLERFGEEKERLETWTPEKEIDKDGLGAMIEEARHAMAKSSGSGSVEFYNDILRIELTGPRQPHLTMVDLPGLFRRGNKDQSDDDVEVVRDMVKRYMKCPRSIILAVVSAKYDYVLQEVTSLAKRFDSEGLRTMGLITKPDTLDNGSDSESYFVRLAQNHEEELRLGWHVLRNRNFEERNDSSAERDAKEKEFFSEPVWASIASSHCGVEALQDRLSKLLRDQILEQLPSLIKDVQDGIDNCVETLTRLGPVRSSPQDQRRYLTRMAEDYTSLMKQAVEGTYSSPFFGCRTEWDKLPTRLRAVVRGKLVAFTEDMLLKGQSQWIVDSDGEDDANAERRDTPPIPRSEYVEEVTRRLIATRGRELPGLFNPMIVNDLFAEQCEPWEGITSSFANEVLDSAHLTAELIIRRIAASDVSEQALKLIRKKIEELRDGMDSKIKELLTSARQDVMTCNRQLTDEVQQAQRARHQRAFKKQVHKLFGADRFSNPGSKISLDPIELSKLGELGSRLTMEQFGSSLAVDYMEAYYKVMMMLGSSPLNQFRLILTPSSGC
jgi:GTP-binding protein EngB required for normal cell division